MFDACINKLALRNGRVCEQVLDCSPGLVPFTLFDDPIAAAVK